MAEEEKIKVTKKRRSRGDGGIYEYRPGHYRAYLSLGYNEAGKRISKSFTNTNKTELIKQLNEYKAQQQKGELIADLKDTLNNYISRWLLLKKAQVKATTIEGYEYIYNYHMKDTIGNYKIQRITPAILNDYFASRKNAAGLSGCSIKKHKALLHSIFKQAVYEGLLYSNPVERTAIIKVENPEVRALSNEEAQQLLKVARSFYLKVNNTEFKFNQLYQIYHIVYLALTTGLRRGELIGLTWGCVDIQKKTLSVKDTIVEVKGGSIRDTPKTESAKRTIALDNDVIAVLNELRPDEGTYTNEDYIFRTTKGSHFIPSNVNRAFTILLDKANIKCRFHDLRHTHATMLISNGLDVKTISQRLGHSDIITTLNKYTHVVSEVDQKAASTIVKLLKKQPRTTET